MATPTGPQTEQPEGLTQEEEPLREIFGPQPKKALMNITSDRRLLRALDAISDSIELNVGRWNSELDLIEDDLSRSAVLKHPAEAAQ